MDIQIPVLISLSFLLTRLSVFLTEWRGELGLDKTKVVSEISKHKNKCLKLIFTGLLFWVLFLGTNVFGKQSPYPNVVFHASTAEEEAKYIWVLINKIEFFTQNGYRISLQLIL